MATSYTDLIRSVIRDFDEIYSVLRAKGSQYDGSALPTSGDTGIATADYANIINSNLVKVNGLSVNQLVAPGNMLDNNTGTTTSGVVSIDYANKGISITGVKPGYYNASSILSLGATFVDLDIDAFELSTDNKNYVLTPTTNIISSVTIAKGKIEGSASAVASSVQGEAPKAEVDTVVEGTIISSENSTGAYPITVTVTPQLSGKIVANVSADTITPGYIKDENDVVLTGAAYNISGITVAPATETYYVAKGSVTLNSSNTNITPSVATGQLELGTDENDGYAVTATVGNVTLTATTVVGYVTEEEVSLNASALTNSPVTKYIKKGSVSGAASNVTKPAITLTSTIAAAESYTGDTYEVKASTGAITLDHTVVEGYVKAGDVADLTLAAEEQTIKIAHGRAVAKIASNNIVADSSEYLATTGREFTIRSTPLISKEFTEGYIKDTDYTLQNTGTTATQTFNIKEGVVGTPSNTLSVTPSFTDTNNVVKTQIFKEAAPTSGDYYTIEANSSVGITGGWIDSQTISKLSNKYYVPKATFEFVKSDAEDPKQFIQVTTGGYIPSGAIVELEGELSEADYAVVGLQVSTDSGSISDDSLSSNYYSIIVGKSTIDAGYISDGNGTVTPHEIKVAHGSVSDVNSVDTITAGAITGDAENGYVIPITAAASSIVTITEGYIKTTGDLTVNGEAHANGAKKEFSKLENIALAAGAVQINTDAVTGDVAAEGFSFASTETKYAIKPTIGGASGAGLKVTTKTVGYIGENYSTTANVSLGDDNSTTRYLTPGTKLTSVNGSGTVAISNNFNTNQSGAYTISLTSPNATNIAVSGTLAEGYYASSDEKAVSGTATITGLTGAVSVAHGSVKVTSATAALSVSAPAGLTLHNSSTGLDGAYELTLDAQSFNLDATTVEGYVKSGDVSNIATTVGNSSSIKYFISKYVNNNSYEDTTNYVGVVNGFGAPTNTDVETWVQNDAVVAQASDTVVIATAGKYVEKDIEVRLAPNAAGSAVRNELYTLQQRLLGKGVKEQALA